MKYDRKNFRTNFPHTWRWTCAQMKAAERDPATPQHILAELRGMAQWEWEEMANSPGLKLYRANAALLTRMGTAMPAMRDASLDEALDVIDAVRSDNARKAVAKRNTGPRASRYAAQHPEWLSTAQHACRELTGTAAARKRVVTAVLVKRAPAIPRRTLAAFVATHWREIALLRRVPNRWNLSV